VRRFWLFACVGTLRAAPSAARAVCRQDDTRETYAEMRDEFYAGLEDRKYLTLSAARGKGSVKPCPYPCSGR